MAACIANVICFILSFYFESFCGKQKSLMRGHLHEGAPLLTI